MSYKTFKEWCNLRACDGCWSMFTAIQCIEILQHFKKLPFWKRKKEWQKISDSVKIFIQTTTREQI